MVSERNIPKGGRVRIHSLQSPRGRMLNEHFGIVIGFNETHKRYKVMVDDSNTTGLFSADHLSHQERNDGITLVDLLGSWGQRS